MTDTPSLTRRGVLKTVGTVALGTSQLDGVGAAPNSVGPTQRPARARATSATQDGEGVTEDVTVSVDRDAETIRYTFEYQIPDDTDEFDVGFELLERVSFRDLIETRQVKRETVNDGPDRFVWTGIGTPQLVLEDDLAAAGAAQIGYYTDTELFWPATPTSDFGRQTDSYSDSAYTLEGTGFANQDLLYAGPHESARRVVDGTELAVILPESADASVDTQRTLDLLTEWQTLIGGLRLSHPATACAVVPGQQMDVSGRAVGGSFYISDRRWTLDSIENVVSHEFAHTVFGVFGTEKMYWFKEAVAEYYGYLLALNTGLGDFEAFLDALSVDSVYQDAVLTDAEKRLEDTADYSKGAHVLAALDAEIRRQSDGAQSLLSVFERSSDSILTLARYRDFKNVVSGTTLSLDGEAWVDQYVDGDELPEVPAQRDRYTFRGRGVPTAVSTPTEVSESILEVEHGESFEISTEIEPLGATPETVPVELLLDFQRVGYKNVELGGNDPARVTFTDADVRDIEPGRYDMVLRVGGNRISSELVVAGPPEFRVNNIAVGGGAFSTSSQTVRNSFTADIDVRNVGDAAGTVTLELLLVGDGDEQTLDTQTVDITGLTTETVTVEDVDISSVDPGEYTLVARTGDDTHELSLVVEAQTESATEDAADETETETAEETESETDEETSDDASGPGFGIVSTVTGLGGIAYVLGRFGDENTADGSSSDGRSG